MKNCWKAEPTERPTFAEIRAAIQDMLLDDEVSDNHLKIKATSTNRNIRHFHAEKIRIY